MTAGFTMVEVLIGSLITMAVVGAIVGVIIPAQTMFRAQAEAAELHQRIRATADTLTGDLRAASAVRPYRVGAIRDDGLAGIYYRPDAIAVLGDAQRTYYFKADTFELMQYDGGSSDLPMIEHVVSLTFEYIGVASPSDRNLVTFDPNVLVDGPWSEDASHRRFDADLQRVRAVRISARFESTTPSLRPFVPDETIVLHVALRNIAPVE